MVRTCNTPEKEDRRAKKGQKNERNRKKMEEKKEKKKRKNQNQHALRAQAESRGDKVSVCWYISPMTRPGGGPTEGRHDKTRRKPRQENGTKQNKRGQRHRAKKQKQKHNQHFWWGEYDTRNPREGRDGGPKTTMIIRQHKITKQNNLEHRVTQSTQRCRVRGVPSTLQGTGQHSKRSTETVTQKQQPLEVSLERRSAQFFGGSPDFLEPA